MGDNVGPINRTVSRWRAEFSKALVDRVFGLGILPANLNDAGARRSWLGFFIAVTGGTIFDK